MDGYITPDGLILTGDLRRLQIDDRALRHGAADGRFHQLHRGAYVSAVDWAAADVDARYRMRIRAVAAVTDRAIVSHESAAALHGMPLQSSAHRAVHLLTSMSRGSRRTTAIHRHATRLDLVDPVEVEGVLVTSIARTLVDLARSADAITAVACLDWALKRGVVGRDDVLREAAGMTFSAGRGRLERIVQFADPRSGSLGESASRVVIHLLGFPAPDLQVSFSDTRGEIGIVDFYWEIIRLIGEFDGKRKYVGDRFGSRLSGDEIVFAEKRREDRLRATRRGMVRWGWGEWRSPMLLHRLLSDAGLQTERRLAQGL